jgi:hypothetical protein
MGHGRRHILWFGVTAHPTAEWIANQVTQACGWEQAPRYLIRDRDGTYGEVFIRRIRSMGIRDRPTSPRSPWQNGYAERLIGSIRRECLDHVVVFGEHHLRHLLAHIYPWRKMHRSRVPSIAPGTFFVAQSWADCITNMPGFNLRQAHLTGWDIDCRFLPAIKDKGVLFGSACARNSGYPGVIYCVASKNKPPGRSPDGFIPQLPVRDAGSAAYSHFRRGRCRSARASNGPYSRGPNGRNDCGVGHNRATGNPC